MNAVSLQAYLQPPCAMPAYSLADLSPKLHPNSYIAPGAHVIGAVELADGASVWFNVVIRGDTEWIRIGPRSNVQEGAVLHTDLGFPLTVGQDVTIGHQAMLHGCTIGDGSLIGIQAVVLNGAKIGRNCLIGAGAIVTEGKEIPDNSLVLGAPGKVVRTLSEDDAQRLRLGAGHYVQNALRFRTTLRPLDNSSFDVGSTSHGE
jgi:carbonic anhydrase/acetyltransferase-like protein (isoleucine patch superfamily)